MEPLEGSVENAQEVLSFKGRVGEIHLGKLVPERVGQQGVGI